MPWSTFNIACTASSILHLLDKKYFRYGKSANLRFRNSEKLKNHVQFTKAKILYMDTP